MTTGLHFLGHTPLLARVQNRLLISPASATSTVLVTGWTKFNGRRVYVDFSKQPEAVRSSTTARSVATTMDCQTQRCDSHS